MVDLELLSELGCTQKALKALFTADKPTKQVDNFVKVASDRIKEGVENNVRDYRLFWAIDRALDAPFYSKSYALFKGLLDQKWDSKKVLDVLQEWGAGSWIKTQCGCGKGCTNASGCPTPQRIADLPTFFEVEFPIALAYLRIRVARMYNERNLTPLLNYLPRVNTPEERLRNQLITQRVDIQTQQMNYRAVLRQLILQSTAYGTCLMLPHEAWYAEQHPTSETTGKKKKRVMRTEREGVRYDHPHPSRYYYDMAYPAYTINSDTGCRWYGDWALVRYGDVADNPDYWNQDQISFGRDTFRITDSNRLFFETVYPCQMQFPAGIDVNDDESHIVGKIDREKRMNFYTRGDRDKALLLTNHFQKVNPLRELGLKNKDGDGYDGDVWFRLVFCADDTVVYAEPLAYRPGTWSGYDADANRYRNPSIVLETLPAEYMIHNLFSQAILQAKNNLANVNFVNTDAIGQEYVDQLENFGEKAYRRPIFIKYSAHESRSLSEDKRDAITPVIIQKMPISDLLTLVRGILDMLERALVMSSQEIASSASHEQTAQEVTITAQSTSTRLTYTGSFIDDAIYAWQEQLFEAGIAYWDDQIFAEVALQEQGDEKVLEKLGFTIESRNVTERTAGVRGSKSKLSVAEFTVRRDAADRVHNNTVAAQMVQLFTAFSNNPILIQSIGVGQVVKVFNEIATIAGLPRDFRLSAVHDPIQEAKDERDKAMKAQSEQAVGQLQQLLPKIAEQVKQQTIAEIGQQLKPVFEKSAEVDQQQSQQIQAASGGLQQLAQVTAENRDAIAKLVQLTQVVMQPSQPAQPPIPPVMPSTFTQ